MKRLFILLLLSILSISYSQSAFRDINFGDSCSQIREKLPTLSECREVPAIGTYNQQIYVGLTSATGEVRLIDTTYIIDILLLDDAVFQVHIQGSLEPLSGMFYSRYTASPTVFEEFFRASIQTDYATHYVVRDLRVNIQERIEESELKDSQL